MSPSKSIKFQVCSVIRIKGPVCSLRRDKDERELQSGTSMRGRPRGSEAMDTFRRKSELVNEESGRTGGFQRIWGKMVDVFHLELLNL